MLFKVIFSALFFTVLVLINIYTYKRLIAKLDFKAPYKRLLKIFFALIVSGEVGYLALFKTTLVAKPLMHVLAICLGVAFMLFATALLYDLLLLIARLGAKTATPNSVPDLALDPSRRRALKSFLDLGILFIFAGYALRGLFEGARQPGLKKVAVKLPRLEHPLKIVQITDVHVGNATNKKFVCELVRRINALEPDLVAITGDLIDGEPDLVLGDLASLKNLRSKYGTYYCLGNHEYFYDTPKILAGLADLGIRTLKDEHLVIDGRFNLVGLQDLMARRLGLPHDFKAPFKACDPSFPTIVLSHQPKQIFEFEEFAPDLVLSGHTHGGQIFPFSLLVALEQPYLAGLYSHSADTQIYVSRGTGFWGPAIRFLAPSELTLLEISA